MGSNPIRATRTTLRFSTERFRSASRRSNLPELPERSGGCQADRAPLVALRTTQRVEGRTSVQLAQRHRCLLTHVPTGIIKPGDQPAGGASDASAADDDRREVSDAGALVIERAGHARRCSSRPREPVKCPKGVLPDRRRGVVERTEERRRRAGACKLGERGERDRSRIRIGVRPRGTS